MSWTIIVLIICVLIAAFAVWKEYKRAKKANLLLRIIATLLAIAALACIALPINYSKDVTALDDHSAILLTPGFNPDSLGSYKSSKLFTSDREIEKSYPKAKLIRLDELKADSPAITKLHIFGDGLGENELKQIAPLPVVFHPSETPAGITAIGWNEKLKAGENLRVQGKYNNNHNKSVSLILKGLNTQVDTLTIPAKTNREFELTTIPKVAGRAVYHVQAISGKDTLTDENLPVEISQVNPLKILILSASPDFETRFLKNWLSENGFEVAVRSAISKDKFSTEYVNMSPVKVDHLSASLLEKFDLVIGDLSVLKSLNGSEKGILEQQVKQKGLGVIIRADSSSKTASWLQNNFPVERLNVKEPKPISLIINGKKGKSAGLKIDPNYIRPQAATQPLVSDEQKHLLVSSSLAGEGRLVFTTANNTFNWMLAGDKDDYGAFWSLLIGKAARKSSVDEQWAVVPVLPIADQPVSLNLETPMAPAVINSDQIPLAPVQNPLIPFEWSNANWPSSAGWHSVKQNNGQQVWWYVYGNDAWKSVKAAKRIADTRRYASDNTNFSSVTKPIHEKLQIAVPKIYFYLLLLLACTFLWVEGKGLTLPSPKERVLK
ncbi:MAG TPA: hypothetical protein VK668_19005 [Mucilaginibacter sp.]|nr:hypothetical protein [Mucilaginibacter sp.]